MYMLADISTRPVDAIVAPANTSLSQGNGVNRAIHITAGPGLVEACLAFPADQDGVRCVSSFRMHDILPT